jgi:hypothetical protein
MQCLSNFKHFFAGSKFVCNTLQISNIFLAGSKFVCSVLIAPVKNEHGEVIMFIINYEDITSAATRTHSVDASNCRNSKLSE